jgi:hypothetical protein
MTESVKKGNRLFQLALEEQEEKVSSVKLKLFFSRMLELMVRLRR